MKTNSSIYKFFCFLLILFIAACQSATPVATSTLSPELLPTNTPIPIPTSTPDPVDACKLIARATTNVGLGFPVLSERLPSTGTVKAAVLFVDFADAPATGTPEQLFSRISPDAEKFFNDVSYGKMTYELVPHFVWLRLSQPPEHYAAGLRESVGHREFIQEAVDLADDDVDFSSVEQVIVMVSPQVSAIGFGPAFGGTATDGIRADGMVIANGVTSGADLLNWGFLWLNHETGHNLSLVDLYAYQYDNSNYDDSHRFVGIFGLMGLIGGNAPEYFAFERWQLGWLNDNEIVCQQADDQTTLLTAIEKAGGTKAVIVPISKTKAVVIESRRRAGYDQKLVKEGALVYIVNTVVYSGEGTITVYPLLDNDPYRNQSPLAVGESVTVEGVTITVLEATDEGDTVQVMVNK